MAVSLDTVIAGAPNDDDDGTASGVGFAFQRVGGAWIFNAKIRPPGLEAIDRFGLQVAVEGTCAAFTAPGDDDVQVDAGAIYLYERSGSMWALANELQAAVPVGGDQLGRGLDFAFGKLAASTYSSEAGPAAGAVRLFRRLAGTWTEEVRIVPSDAANDDDFGQPIAIGDDVVLVAARSDDDFGADSGSVYVTGRRFFAHGTGCLGTGGFTPVLDAWGDPVPGGSVVLDVADALGGAPLFLFLGAQAAELDMGAGCALNLQHAAGPYGPVPLQGSEAGNGARSACRRRSLRSRSTSRHSWWTPAPSIPGPSPPATDSRFVSSRTRRRPRAVREGRAARRRPARAVLPEAAAGSVIRSRSPWSSPGPLEVRCRIGHAAPFAPATRRRLREDVPHK